jgi:peptidoglycan/xylan/chitin deacetylase (PgdA/CDA1 family)
MAAARMSRLVKHVVSTKGWLRTVQRSGQIVSRFTLGRQRFASMIASLESDVPAPLLKITFCVTARLLDQHAGLIRRLQSHGHELAAHGYFHTDMAQKSRAEQDQILLDTYRAFEEHDLRATGFRCPYLSYNQDTVDALKASRFAYSSHEMVLWRDIVAPHAADEAFLSRLWELYHVVPAEHAPTRPRMLDRLVEIPLTGPDDEMLFDRCGVRDPQTLTDVWSRVFERCHARGDLFHLLFHPERFAYLKSTLYQLALRAKAEPDPVWFCSLSDLTQWWSERARARWVFEKTASGDYQAWIRVPSGGTVVRNESEPSSSRPIYGNSVEAIPIARRGDSVAFAGSRSRKQMIGLSERCDPRLAEFLTEEGYPVERSDRPDLYSMYLDGDGNFRENDRVPLLEQIEQCRNPILRLWRWPFHARSAFAVSSDVDSISLGDFVQRAIHF